MSLARFVKVYSNLPLNARKEVVLVIEVGGKDKPITWDVAYLEIKSRSKIGERILKKLIELNII